ncbi:MAG: hypothetical protein FJ117_00955 [Deltaproteobacteria bacterium]|nr:hypothetical protein [Deltaproteobacteria bacterium]
MGILSKVTRTIKEGALASAMATTRKLTGGYDIALRIIAVSFSVFFLYTTFFGLISQESHIGLYFLGTFVVKRDVVHLVQKLLDRERKKD